MMVFKRKQIVILALILMIVVAGYLQYSYRQGSNSAESGGKLGEAVYVDNEIDNEGIAGADQNTSDSVQVQKNVSASKMANDFFAEAKMDKDTSRSKNNESLKAIADDVNATKENKQAANEKMIALTEISDKEMRIETMINKMGFADSFVLFADDGSVDIVVKTPSLSTSQTAQIADVVARQGDVEIKDIHISTKF